MKIFNKKNAFTLAEVLITIGLIGVLAAMTIPTLNNRSRDQENLARFKTMYTRLETALQGMDKVYSCYYVPTPEQINANFPRLKNYVGKDNNNKPTIVNLNLDNANITRDCDRDNGFYRKLYATLGDVRSVNASDRTSLSDEMKKYMVALDEKYSEQNLLNPIDTINILQDGSFIMRIKADNAEQSSFYIDTNGIKKPNMFGQDIFKLSVYLVDAGSVVLHPGEENEFIRNFPKQVELYPAFGDTETENMFKKAIGVE